MSEKIEVIVVRFKEVGKVYYFDPEGEKFSIGDRVIVETSRGTECGEVAADNRFVDEEKVVMPLKKVLRFATAEDLEHVEENNILEKQAFEYNRTMRNRPRRRNPRSGKGATFRSS